MVRIEDKEETAETLAPTEASDEDTEAARLIRQGVSFFSGLVQTLRSPEGIRSLADSLIEEDKETGKATLRIPVPDKESVIGFLSLAGKLLSGFEEKK